MHRIIETGEVAQMILLPSLLKLTTGHPTVRVLTLDNKYAEPGYDQVIDLPRASSRGYGHVVENGVAIFLEAGRQDSSDPGFSNIAPETGRADKDDQ